MDTINEENAENVETRSITPEDFNNKLSYAGKKTASVPVTITMIPDPYVKGVGYKKVIPVEIRKAMDNSTEGIEIEGTITPVKDVNRFGSTPYTYLFRNNVSGEYFFRFYPKNIKIRPNLNGLNMSVNSVSSLEIQISEEWTLAPVKVENPEIVTESINNTFLTFLESLKRSDEDVALIESVKQGYIKCMNLE